MALPDRHRAGVDEAGRGPLAGPVYAAAVILDRRRRIRGLDDSKRLSEATREALAPLIRERALAWAIGDRQRRGDRPHQHLPGDHAGDAPRRGGPRRGARRDPGRRQALSAGGVRGARHRRRRREGSRDLGCVDPRQDRARRRDARAARTLSRSTASIATRATRPPSISRRCARTAPARSIAAASAPVREVLGLPPLPPAWSKIGRIDSGDQGALF